MSNRNPAYMVLAIDKIAECFVEDCQHAARMKPIANQLRNSTEALGTLFTKPNPTDTIAAQQKRVAIASNRLREQAQKAERELQRIIGDAHSEVQGRIDAKINLKENCFAAEIRAAFRTMSQEEKLNTLKSLIQSNSGPELAAILNAPSLLVGIPADMQQLFKTNMMNTHAPAEMAEHQKIVKAYGTASSVARVAMDAAAEFANPARLSEIEAREAEARAAEAAFSSALQS